MANKRVSELNSLVVGDLSPSDLFLISDVTAQESKKLTVADLNSYILNNGNLTGSFYGTSSYAYRALTASYISLQESASYAKTASVVIGSILSATSASYTLSSSISTTASYSLVSQTSTNATTSSYTLNTTYAATSSYVYYTGIDNGRVHTSSYALTSSVSTTASYSISGSHSLISDLAYYSIGSDSAINATTANSATTANTANTATTASYVSSLTAFNPLLPKAWAYITSSFPSSDPEQNLQLVFGSNITSFNRIGTLGNQELYGITFTNALPSTNYMICGQGFESGTGNITFGITSSATNTTTTCTCSVRFDGNPDEYIAGSFIVMGI